MLIGVITTNLNLPEVRIHGMKLSWFSWFIGNYLNGFLLNMCLIFMTKGIDKIVAIVFLFWDIIGFGLFLVNGWPEPKLLIISGFGFSLVLYLILAKWT